MLPQTVQITAANCPPLFRKKTARVLLSFMSLPRLRPRPHQVTERRSVSLHWMRDLGVSSLIASRLSQWGQAEGVDLGPDVLPLAAIQHSRLFSPDFEGDMDLPVDVDAAATSLGDEPGIQLREMIWTAFSLQIPPAHSTILHRHPGHARLFIVKVPTDALIYGQVNRGDFCVVPDVERWLS